MGDSWVGVRDHAAGMGSVKGDPSVIDASSQPFPGSVAVNVNGREYHCTADGAAAFAAAKERVAQNPDSLISGGPDAAVFAPSTWLAPATKHQQFPTP